ncbi:hypothetical protein EVAR_100385_1 [Eumeta japonica]|uniref:Uncharacterized protein n=1 Tax=Eumeta variegata TaxID=151549 RepID=A0A4C1ZT93_EUMVA|nr:hypothetical protein EVAR_100385_1 [Eumeta japonica]
MSSQTSRADPAFASEESHSGGLVRTGFNSVTIRQRPGSGMIKTPMTPLDQPGKSNGGHNPLELGVCLTTSIELEPVLTEPRLYDPLIRGLEPPLGGGDWLGHLDTLRDIK